ncbi:MAG: pyrroloquinoline quinone biosynthesis peptide chaperone PqqD [Polyangiales bacterium]
MIPSLARRARLRWDPTRGCHALLYPEGVLVLNPEAAEVIERIDGARSVEHIVDALCEAHPEAPRETLSADVTELLEQLVARGFVKMSEP